MSDSFADLWNSSVPQKKPQTLSSLAQQSTQQPNQQRKQQGSDLFTLLSSSPSPAARSSPSIHSLTPSANSTPPPQKHAPPLKSTPSGDAFSDLLSSSSFTSSSSQNLTIAQRAALAEKQRKEALLSQQKRQEKEKSTWVGLDSLGGGFGGLTPTPAVVTSAPTSVAKATSSGIDDDDWGLGDFGKPTLASSQDKPKPTTGTPARGNQDDGWGLDDFESAHGGLPTTRSNSTVKASKTIWDIDEFSSSPPATTNIRNGQNSRSRVDSPSNDFDFGNREDTLLNGNNNDDGDDFMGVFSKPPQPKRNPLPRSSSPRQPTASTSSRTPPSNTTRSGSPPPHILGQIVEMGFSVPKAKAALAANNNDVQAALDQLLSSEGGHTSSGRGTPASRHSPAPQPQQPQQSQPGIPRRRDREILRERDPRRPDTASPASATGSADIQAQAEQILAQASEIGRGMFTKASTFWKEKKVQVQKVVEEQVAGVRVPGATGVTNNTGAGASGSGRPKWMQQRQDELEDEDPESPKKGGFRDDNDDGVGASQRQPEARVPRRVDRQREKERERERVREREIPAPPSSQTLLPQEEPEIDLFAPSESVPAASVELFDTHGHNSFQDSLPTKPSPAARSRPQPSQRRPQPPPRFQRDTAPIPSTIASLKAEANATFKLGQFGNAEQLYTRAVDSLGKSAAPNHVYYVLLLNNRANARMKTGDVSGAVRDCEAVIGLIAKNQLDITSEVDAMLGGGKVDNDNRDPSDVKIDWEPSQDGDAKLRIPIQGGNPSSEVVDLGEGLTKAIKRRAEAYEGMEKWGKGRKDWEWLRNSGWVRESLKGEAGRGVGRCTRMIEGNTNSTSGVNNSSSSQAPKTPVVRPKPKPTPKPTNNARPSEALQALRSTTAKADAEDQAKHELKDAVDAKLSNWKSGKETNIRALLASLDLVLWEELLGSGGGVKVGMHELVTPAQVKIKYMKAVAKVHPDKLSTSNSTLEQRMIAQGVFGALNEAWNAFKQ